MAAGILLCNTELDFHQDLQGLCPNPSFSPCAQQGLSIFYSLLGAEAYFPYAVLTNVWEGMEEEIRGL